jgi:hypothetical protein
MKKASCTCGRLWHAGRVGQTECEHAAAGLDQERVRVAVVAPRELDQLREDGSGAVSVRVSIGIWMLQSVHVEGEGAQQGL